MGTPEKSWAGGGAQGLDFNRWVIREGIVKMSLEQIPSGSKKVFQEEASGSAKALG